MDYISHAFEVLIVLIFLYWSSHLIAAVLISRKVPLVKNLPPGNLVEFPKVSIILTARNEAPHLKRAMLERLDEDYPNVEFILIDDRSTDETPKIVDELSREDNRVKALHVKNLPQGWLGKLNAMSEGLKVSNGEWILFSDADMFIDKEVLKKTLAYAQENSIDHLCIFPEFLADTLSLKILFSGLTRILCVGGRLWSIANPKSTAAVGVGGFNLVRRSAFEKTKGLEWIKMDVADDVALGTMMKRAGFKSSVLGGKEKAKVYLYKTWAGSIRGTEKASYTTIGSFNPFKIIALLLALILEFSPFYAFAFGISMPFVILSIMAVVVSTLASILLDHWLYGKFLRSIFWPFGLLSVMALTTYGFFSAWIKGGIDWRDTFYTSKTLKEGKRFFLFSKGKF